MTVHPKGMWVISTDSNHCRIYRYDYAAQTLEKVKEINHPELRLKNSEFLTSDKPGHYQGSDSAGGAYSPHTDPKEVKIIEFVREIDQFLNQSRNKNLYGQLMIIAPPHMDGLLLKHLDKQVVKLVTHTIRKDLVHTEKENIAALVHAELIPRLPPHKAC